MIKILILLLLPIYSLAQTVCLTDAEKELYTAIMEYRAKQGLPEIPISVNLTKVAHIHARDLSDNRPFNDKCNMHSWSKKGVWKACCYTDDHKRAQCMWDKPRELSDYKADGYEIAHGYSNYKTYPGVDATAQTALEGWKKSKGHNMVIVNKGIWKDVKWQAIGIGMYKDFAVVWFGQEIDVAGAPEDCE